MKHLVTVHLEGGERLVIHQMSDCEWELGFAKADCSCILSGNYSLNYFQSSGYALVWCGSRLIFFDGIVAKEIEENDFIGRVFLANDFIVVGDNHIITRRIKDFDVINIHFHDEIISDCWLSGSNELTFIDIAGNTHSFDLAVGVPT